LYTNLDTFHNKKNELMSRISVSDPDIIGLTEIKPKMASWVLCEIDLLITQKQTTNKQTNPTD